MLLSEIVTEILTNTKRPEKDSTARTGIKLAIDRIYARHTFRGFRKEYDADVSAGGSYVSFASDHVALRSAIWLADATSTQSWPIWVKTKEWIYRRYPNPASVVASYPYIGYIENNRLNVFPFASVAGIIRLSYDAKLALVNNSDENTIVGLDRVLISFGTAYVFKSIQLFAEAQQWEADGTTALEEAVVADNKDSAEVFQADWDSREPAPFIEPWQDPFAGHRTSWTN